MWPFDRREERERQWIRQGFSKYLSRELVEQLVANPRSLTMGEMTKAEVRFLLFQVRDSSLGDIRDLMNRAIAIAADTGGVIDCLMSSMMLVTFGIIAPPDGIPEDQQLRAVAALIEKLGTDIRVLYGRAQCLHGTVGTDARFFYSVLLPDFGASMKRLLDVDFGTSVETGEIGISS
jgi:hypothetical protein